MLFRNSEQVRNDAKRSPRGHWSFLGPGAEEQWYGTHTDKGRFPETWTLFFSSAHIVQFGATVMHLVGHLEECLRFLVKHICCLSASMPSHIFGWSSPRYSIQPALGRITSCVAPPCLRSGGILESFRVSNSVQQIVFGQGKSIFDFSAAASGPATGMSAMSSSGAL